MLRDYEVSNQENGPRPEDTLCTGRLPVGVCVLLAWYLTGIESDPRVCDALLPLSSTNARKNTVQELFHGAGPSTDPRYGARLAFALVSAQLVDAYTFCQPQRSWKRYILVQALFQQYPASETVGYGAA